MPADDVVMRIVIQDDGKTPPASSGVAQSSGSASSQTPSGTPQGTSPTYAQASQFAQQTPAGAHASIFTASQVAPRAGADKLPTVTRAREEDDPAREIAGAVARSVGIDNRLLLAALAARDFFKEKPPVAQIVQPRSVEEALPEVMAAPRLVQVNKPVVSENLWAKRPQDWELAGAPSMKVNLPNQYPIRAGNLPGVFDDKMAPRVSAPVGPAPYSAAPAGANAAVSAAKPLPEVIAAASAAPASMARTAAGALPSVIAAAGGGAGAGAATAAAGAGAAGISAIAAPVAIAVGAIAALTYAFTKATQHFIERGRELEKYSPELAGAGARQSVRDVQTDVREAQKLGPAYAGLSDQWGELKMTLNEVLMPLKEFFVESLTMGIRLLNDIIALFKPLIDAANWLLSIGGGLLLDFIDRVLAGIEKIIEILIWPFKNKVAELPEPIRTFIENAWSQNAVGRRTDPNDPLKKAADQRLTIPAFAGL